MMVIFVSQCEKKALKRTRRVLDAFADRIGDNTWQTVITDEGLQAVRKLLRQTASKNTAVSCHWIRTRARSDLLWVVGKRDKFDYRGIVPVNYTEKDMSQFTDKIKWNTLPVIQYAAAIAGLFHDFGKATVLFQDKINPNKKTESFEPYRHEWISMRLFQSFVNGKTDGQWLDDLANGNINIESYCKKDINKDNNPLTIATVPPFARLIVWLVLSHHKLPKYPDFWEGDFNNSPAFENIDNWLGQNFSAIWNSPKCKDSDQKNRVADNWKITDNGLPTNSFQWKSKACLIASKAQKFLPQNKYDKNWIHDEIFTSHISRMALMLADHHFSSLTYNETNNLGLKNNYYSVYANTYYSDDGTKKYKQQLDEHLIGVADNAERIVKQLPKFINELESLPKNDLLEGSVLKTLKTTIENKEKVETLYKKFSWQDDAKLMAKKIAANTLENGFFGINMASTGCGKTIANAKIMYTLGKETGKTRFNVALGLRTLTLQTGREFQDSLGLSDDEISIAVGGIAVKALFENQQNKADDKADTDEEKPTGSDSESDYLNPDLQINYSGKTKEHALSEWTRRKGKERTEQLIQPPVLVCTIDHLIPATEGIKGGQQIAPMLRLMSSDLILDEPDDFGLEDLPALCRLVHWSAMLGSRVLLSTATMPPAFVYACFEAYQEGWAEYTKANLDNWNSQVQCAWFDERGKPKEEAPNTLDAFRKQHNQFVSDRVKFLEKQPPKRIGKIVDVIESSQNTVYENMAETIYQSINKLHLSHHISKNNKNVSIGLVRMANIDPMIAVAKALMTMDAPQNTCIHYCVYHSRFPLAVRSHIEEKLDFILKRKDPKHIWEVEQSLGEIIDDDNQHHIFVVLASPVAEVGRDHDYDWAVVEPSSMRSIIQLAGRVLRHRDIYPETANIYLLNKNIKGLRGKDICFEKPGFESSVTIELNGEINELTLDNHDLNIVLRQVEFQTISSVPKVKMPSQIDRAIVKKNIKRFKYKKLNDLEHIALFEKLSKGKKTASAWWRNTPQWCGELQRQQKFRHSKKDDSFRLWIKDEYHKVIFKWLNENKQPPELGEPLGIIIEHEEWQPTGKRCDFWLDLQPLVIYQSLAKDFNKTLEEISESFGEFRIVQYDNQQQIYAYHDNLGIYKI